MFNWKKLGRIFNPKEVLNLDYLKEFAQAPSILIFEDFIRVYFSCRPNPDQNGQYVSYSTFLDLDRNNLFSIINISTSPILDLGEAGTFDEFGTYPVSVIKFNDEFRAYYAGWTRCESVPFNVAIGLAKSNNPDFFNKKSKGPILSYSIDEPFILSGPKVRMFNNLWYLFYIAGSEWILDNGKPEPVYKIRMAISSDGENWKKENRNLIENTINIDEAQASPDVFYKDGIYHMFFCYRNGRGFRSKENGYRIGYAFSNDLLNWTRDDSKAGITVSDEGWDSQMVSYPHVFELDGEFYMMYLGNDVGREGFGLAKLIDNE
jgi:predicted GH43/DUF377 family glycosyl hydrolase